MKHTSFSKSWRSILSRLRCNGLSPAARKILIGAVGSLVLLAGLAMIVLPGPALLFIPAGVALLATEFTWARQLFRKARNLFRRAGNEAGFR